MVHSRCLVWGVVLALGLTASSCVEPDSTSVSDVDTSVSDVDTSVSDVDTSVSDVDTSDPAVPLEVTWAPIDDEAGSAGRTLLPLQMYYVERYLADVPDKTAADLAFAAILDESPETLDFYVGALESYRAMPESAKAERFDPGVVQMLASYTEPFELSAFLEVVDPVSVILDLVAQPPLPPSDLVAVNASRPGSIEQDPTGGGQIGPDPVYSVTLTWQDNAFNEDGFRIYRWPYPTLASVAPDLLEIVGQDSRSFEDRLPEPASVDDMICYQVTAYRETPLDPESPFVESAPTEAVCVEYHWSKVDLGIDTGDDDNDGFINEYDDCPSLHDNGAVTTRGCPDADGDGWPDDGTDRCESEWGELFVPGEEAYAALPGCPQRFGVNWMGMEATNNSISYAYGINNITTPDGKWAFLSMNEVDDREGEEPYLIFEWVNGWSDTGDHETGQAQWCCGEGIDVAAGSVREPDGTTLAEGDQALDRAVLDHGLVVFPPGDISKTPGLLITTILMEMDWTAMVRPESADTAMDLLEAAGEAALIVGGCITSAGIGCLIDIGVEIVEAFLAVFGAASSRIEVDDPDDVMGDAVWVMTHQEALFLTAEDGAHGFLFEAPNPNAVACLDGAIPCPIEIATPSRLTVNVEMCIYREDVPAEELKDRCKPYDEVLPWPMEPLTTP